jgi:predicted metalloprotease with PDZ domain
MKRVLERFFVTAVNGTADLPLKAMLGAMGLTLSIEQGAKPALGARTTSAPDGVRLTHVLDDGGAQAAGLSAGDVVIAVDGIKVGNGTLDTLLARRARGTTVLSTLPKTSALWRASHLPAQLPSATAQFNCQLNCPGQLPR